MDELSNSLDILIDELQTKGHLYTYVSGSDKDPRDSINEILAQKIREKLPQYQSGFGPFERKKENWGEERYIPESYSFCSSSGGEYFIAGYHTQEGNKLIFLVEVFPYIKLETDINGERESGTDMKFVRLYLLAGDNSHLEQLGLNNLPNLTFKEYYSPTH